jgi:hypothetical protein
MAREWFPLYHGTFGDPRFLRAVEIASLPKAFVMAGWASAMSFANGRSDDLALAGYGPRWMAVDIGCEEREAERLIGAMEAAGLIVGGHMVEVRPPGRSRTPPESERPSGPVWSAIRARIFARDDYACRYCGGRGGRLECDHVVPVSLGGSHEDSNLVTACFDCNRSKRAKTVAEWLGLPEADHA